MPAKFRRLVWLLATSLPWLARLDQSQILRHNSRAAHLSSASTQIQGRCQDDSTFADQAGQYLYSPVKAGLRHSSMVVSNVSMSRFRGISRAPGLRHQNLIISTVSIVSVFRINDFFVQLVQPEAPSYQLNASGCIRRVIACNPMSDQRGAFSWTHPASVLPSCDREPGHLHLDPICPESPICLKYGF